MFTLITDSNLRRYLSNGDYIRRLNIISSFGKCRIIVRDDHDLSNQIKTLDELKELYKNTSLSGVEIALSSDTKKFHMLRARYNIDTIHMKQSDFKKVSVADLKELRNQGVEIGTSVHSSLECDVSMLKRANYILVSPIFLTKCKLGSTAIEKSTFDYIVSKSKVNYIETVALGGIGYTDLDSEDVRFRYNKFSNFAIRSLFYESDDLKKDLENVMGVLRSVV